MDARVLGVVAEMGRAAVHEVAARLGMDPREVASRLVALSAAGVPLLVGVECDQNGVRAALARMTAPTNYGAPAPGHAGPGQGVHGTPSGVYGAQGTPSGVYVAQQQTPPGPPYGAQGTPSGAYGAQGTPSGVYPPSPPAGYQPQPYQPQQQFPPSGPHQVRTGPPSQPFPTPNGPPSQPLPTPAEPISTWGPPGSSTWARGDQPPATTMADDRTRPTTRPRRQGVAGETLEAEGLEGERLTIQLVEVVDPADYLFTAAGYRLQAGERSVVVHTELTNRGTVRFGTLPDLYLVLVTPDGKSMSKAPVSLSSRPPHRIGVAPGETAGGHTVYVVPEDLEITAVQWSPRPDEESRTLTWKIEN